MPSTHTADDIMGQAFVAFGQGAGSIRVRRETIREIRARYMGYMERALEYWEAEAGQALERVRATGRLAALLATQAGRTVITKEDFTQAADQVRQADFKLHGFFTRICP